MKIVTDLSQFDKRAYSNLVVALGNFDGFHRGHQKIVSMAKALAEDTNGVSSVLTFREHPQRVLKGKEGPQILTSLLHKLVLLRDSGVDVCFLVDFSTAFSTQSPEAFVSELLVGQLGAKGICLGFNARFGRARGGDSQLMAQLAKKHGFQFLEAPPLMDNDDVISSSLIRRYVREGKLKQAGALLGHPYSFFGNIVPGSKRGRELGTPTLNLDAQNEVLPPEGVYTVWARILTCELEAKSAGVVALRQEVMQQDLSALMNYGRRPTFGDVDQAVPEIYFLRFNELVTTGIVEVTIGERLRDEKKFSNTEALKDQIQKDILLAKEWFSKNTVVEA
jgi:riboflavin kinase / FMN adenylyltransferase